MRDNGTCATSSPGTPDTSLDSMFGPTFLAQFPVKQVGDARHRELWIPAERLGELNENIVGTIEIIAEFSSAPEP